MSGGGRYKTSHLVEDQHELGSRGRVLKNLLGIKNSSEIDRTEAIALKQAEDALFQMQAYGSRHQFSAKDVCQIHEIWLGNIYPWAGRYRQVQMNKGTFRFASAAQVPQLMEQFERDVLRQHTPCTFAGDRVIEALAEVHAELMLIHPFREGNGRVGRFLATLMAMQAGLPPLIFTPIEGRGTAPYIRAIHASVGKEYRPMQDVFRQIVRKSLAKRRATGSGA
ncbi:MAG: hypothetical protein A3C53_05165 [Omnitrophica WOR_2 bacterium RIFCSPHIGHO2_02_FULL_68_15]|nr:MAG: hypothetical protein A3C53_05165 [Omnitrophica WOR_2 bacterium RIFCSPHIGHO2_02_FULL_68_15]